MSVNKIDSGDHSFIPKSIIKQPHKRSNLVTRIMKGILNRANLRDTSDQKKARINPKARRVIFNEKGNKLVIYDKEGTLTKKLSNVEDLSDAKNGIIGPNRLPGAQAAKKELTKSLKQRYFQELREEMDEIQKLHKKNLMSSEKYHRIMYEIEGKIQSIQKDPYITGDSLKMKTTLDEMAQAVKKTDYCMQQAGLIPLRNFR